MNILHGFKTIAAFAMVAALFASCSEDQTSMSIKDIKSKAKIIGSLSYSEGQTYSNGAFTELIKVADSVKVYVKVSNKSLSPNDDASGYTTYEAMTDKDGKYEIEIPVVEKEAGTSVIIQPATFIGKRSLLKTMENEKPVFEEKEVVFSIEEIAKTIKPNDIIVSDVKYGFTERDIETGFTTTVPLIVKVGLGISEKSTDKRLDPFTGEDIYTLSGAFNFKSGTNIIISVTYSDEDENGDPFVRKYGATTDSKGEVTFNIPSRDKVWKQVPVSISAMPFYQKSFEYYDTKNKSHDIESGVYKQYYKDNGNVVLDYPKSYSINFNGIEGVNAYEEVIMVFIPVVGVSNYGYYFSEYNWKDISFYEE